MNKLVCLRMRKKAEEAATMCDREEKRMAGMRLETSKPMENLSLLQISAFRKNVVAFNGSPKIISFFFFFVWSHCFWHGELIPQPGIEPSSLHWEEGV